MTNTRIGERLSKVSELPTEDRSQDLPALTKKFQNFVKGFKPLTESLKEHYDAMKTLEKTQDKVRFDADRIRSNLIYVAQIFQNAMILS